MLSSVGSRLEGCRLRALSKDSPTIVADTGLASGGDVAGVVASRVRAIASWTTSQFRGATFAALVIVGITASLQKGFATNSAVRYTASTFNTLAVMALAVLVLGRWVRVSASTFRRIALVSAALLGFIILTGSAVRLSGSGLGCVDWPTCNEGKIVPSVNDYSGMIEFGNRIVTGLCVFAAGLGVLASLVRIPYRRDLVKVGGIVVVAILGNAVLGGLTVLVKLNPRFVMGHFLLAIVALAGGVVLFHRSGEPGLGGDLLGRDRLPIAIPRVAMISRLMTGSAIATLVLGAVVTGSGPHAGDEAAARLNLSMEAVARVHSLAAWVTIASSLLMIWAASRSSAVGSTELRRRTQLLLVVLVGQGSIGYLQWFTQVPARLVQVHVLGAVFVWCAVLWVRAAATLPVEGRTSSSSASRSVRIPLGEPQARSY